MWIWSPTSILVDDEFITIHKRIGRKRIPLFEIQSVTAFVPDVERGFRLCGSGGFAGYYGWYRDSRIGRYFGYYGNRHEYFLVLTIHLFQSTTIQNDSTSLLIVTLQNND